MSIKGFPSQQKLVTGQATKADFATVLPSSDFRNALDTIPRGAFRAGSASVPRTAGVGTGNVDPYGTYVVDTATIALAGDFVRFINGNAIHKEVAIVEVSTNGFRLAARLPSGSTPASGDQFYIMRYATPQYDENGSPLISITPSPIAFVRDGVDTEVEENTTTTANSRPLPVKAVSSYLTSARLDYSSTNVSNAAWTELISSVGSTAVEAITLFDGGGYAMEIGIGGSGSEVRTLLIPPGGFNGVIPLHINSNSRLSVRAVGVALVNAGEIDINLLR